MYLRIPQTRIENSMLTLGILGTDTLRFDEIRVQFILHGGCPYGWSYLDEEIERALGVKVSTSYRENATTTLFSVTVSGPLRNPHGFLKSVARKVGQALKNAEEIEYQIEAEDDADQARCEMLGM